MIRRQLGTNPLHYLLASPPIQFQQLVKSRVGVEIMLVKHFAASRYDLREGEFSVEEFGNSGLVGRV